MAVLTWIRRLFAAPAETPAENAAEPVGGAEAAEHFWSLKAIGAGETRRLQSRREGLAGLGGDPGAPWAGLALSGGGIRSATFSLGLLREFAAQGLLHRFDYLSTVSGGSYIGSYYCSLFADRKSQAAALTGADFPDPFQKRDGLGRASLDWLRQSGRYLAPSGAGDYWYALSMLVRNWLGVQFVIGATLLLIGLLAAGYRLSLYWFTLPPWLGFLHHGLFYWGPLLALLALPAAIHVANGWAYWLTKRDVSGTTAGWLTWAQFGSCVIAAWCIWVWLRWDPHLDSPVHLGLVAVLIGAAAIGGLVCLVLSLARAQQRDDPELSWDARREVLTRPLMWCAMLFAAILVAAAADAFGFWLYQTAYAVRGGYFILPPAALAVGVPVGRWLLSRLAELAGSIRGSQGAKKASLVSSELLLKAGAALIASLLIAVLIGVWFGIAYLLSWPTQVVSAQAVPWDGVGCFPTQGKWSWYPWVGWTGSLAVLAIFIAKTPAFLNLSGLTSFYADRLRRAYLGAGNRSRIDADETTTAAKERVPSAISKKRALDRGEANDDVMLSSYYREGSAAPLHLINITLNETRGQGSNIIQHDRRGRNLVVCPEGIYYKRDQGDEIELIGFDEAGHEQLPLSTWIAISGAAFSTGLGSRTGFPITQLAGLANVRLGYWWRARPWKSSTPTQWDLLREFRGDFSGPFGKFWYLSDGGHFENTGAYELLRRHVPFIVISDNGMDQRFEYEDVANLVRKARIDFDCEIDFYGKDDLNRIFGSSGPLREAFGTQVQIAGGDPDAQRAIAALARASYCDGTHGTIVLVKPRLTGDGPADLIRYKAANQDFPQQSTLDQFFDEAQWESYYHLGRLIAQAVFAPRAAASGDGAVPTWYPSSMKPLP